MKFTSSILITALSTFALTQGVDADNFGPRGLNMRNGKGKGFMTGTASTGKGKGGSVNGASTGKGKGGSVNGASTGKGKGGKGSSVPAPGGDVDAGGDNDNDLGDFDLGDFDLGASGGFDDPAFDTSVCEPPPEPTCDICRDGPSGSCNAIEAECLCPEYLPVLPENQPSSGKGKGKGGKSGKGNSISAESGKGKGKGGKSGKGDSMLTTADGKAGKGGKAGKAGMALQTALGKAKGKAKGESTGDDRRLQGKGKGGKGGLVSAQNTGKGKGGKGGTSTQTASGKGKGKGKGGSTGDDAKPPPNTPVVDFVGVSSGIVIGADDCDQIPGSCSAFGETIECGGTYDGTVTMGSSLYCANGVKTGSETYAETGIAITMIGPDAILDCQNNYIVAPAPDGGEIGVRLENGATAKNCKISGFEQGVVMINGDNALIDSELAYNRYQGIHTSGDGCMEIKNVMVTGSGGVGLLVENDSSINVFDSEFSGFEDNGVVINESDVCAYFDGVVVKANGEHGFHVQTVNSLDIRNSRIIGNTLHAIHSAHENLKLILVDTEMWANGGNGFKQTTHMSDDIDMYGYVFGVGNGDIGIELTPSGHMASVDVWCVAFMFGNGDEGLDLIDANFTVATDAAVVACENERLEDDGLDIDISNGVKTIDGTLHCERVTGSGLKCDTSGCTSPGEALTCA